MGLLGKTFELAKKATTAAIDSANRKLEEAKQKRIEEERRFLESFPYANRYTIKQKDSVSLDLVLWEVLERDSYVIYDTADNPIYIAKGTVLMGKHHFVVTSPDKKQHCKIHKAIFNVPLPFMKDRKTCKIELLGKEPFEIETCISFNEREYSVSGSRFSIKADEKEKEFMIFRKNKKKPDIHIYKVKSDEGFFKDKYYVGFDNPEDGMLAISMAIGIDTIRYAED